MNKYQEALDDLSYPDIYSPCYGDKCGATECGDCKIRRDILTLKELVDKATPKKAKPMYPPLVSTPYRCPCCGTLVRSEIEKFNYCHNCGQAIDWSE